MSSVGVEGNPVQWRLGLDEPPVVLSGKPGIYLFGRGDQMPSASYGDCRTMLRHAIRPEATAPQRPPIRGRPVSLRFLCRGGPPAECVPDLADSVGYSSSTRTTSRLRKVGPDTQSADSFSANAAVSGRAEFAIASLYEGNSTTCTYVSGRSRSLVSRLRRALRRPSVAAIHPFMSSSTSGALVVVISMICTNVITPPPGAAGWPDDGANLSARPRTWSGACPQRLKAQSRCQGRPRDPGHGHWRLRGSG